MQFLTTNELLDLRHSHMDSLARLGRESTGWDEVTRRRGQATARLLIEQVHEIDAELAMAGVKPQGAAA